MSCKDFTLEGVTIEASSFLASLQTHCLSAQCSVSDGHKMQMRFEACMLTLVLPCNSVQINKHHLLKVPAVLQKALPSRYFRTRAAASAGLTLDISAQLF